MTASLGGYHIGLITASASRLGGGVAEAVLAQAGMIRDLGGTATVFALRDAAAEADRERLEPTPLVLADVTGPRQIGYAPGLDRALRDADLDCLHLHGIWMYPSAAASHWAKRTSRPYFISPHGMLDPWITGRGRWKKALARAAYERSGWRRATSLHALTRREADDIERECGRADSVVIPNAGPECRRAAAGGGGSMPGPTVIYIGRIHPKKNLLALVGGWQRAQRPAGARLVIAGWGETRHVDDLQAAVAEGDGSVEFVGPVYGPDKAELLDRARFTILPSHSEGLPMAILESWANGVPAIMTAECNLDAGLAAGAAFDCGYEPSAIGCALEQALTLDDRQWARMSQAALRLAGGPFSTRAVARQWAGVYAAALRGFHHEPA